MFCRNCGYQNPERNGFCGMCGTKLAPETAAEPKPVVAKVPITLERASPQAPSVVAQAVTPVDTPRQPVAPVAEPPRSDKWWVDDKDKEEKKEKEEIETTISGPSFLGLSSAGSGKAGDYSYLFEDEESSHASAWILLVLLLVLGGVLYAKWQPIRNYVLPIRDYLLTMSLSHSRSQPQPAQDTKVDPSSASAAAAPPTTPADNDAASQPAATTESIQNQVAQPAQDLPHASQQPSSADKPDDSAQATPARATLEPAAEPASQPPAAKSAGDKKPAARMPPAPPGNAGDELVSSGERYLYARGVARNCDQAITYFNAAAAKQNPQAFSHLGALYAIGECVPLDRAVAYAWFRRAYAREPGNRYFEQNLTMLWRQMTPAERQRATGRQ